MYVSNVSSAIESTTSQVEVDKRTKIQTKRDNFKLKLKEMRTRIKQKHREFLKLGFSIEFNKEERAKFDFIESKTQEKNVSNCNMESRTCCMNSTTNIENQNVTMSLDISFNLIDQNSNSSSRTSTPICQRKKLVNKSKLDKKNKPYSKSSIKSSKHKYSIYNKSLKQQQQHQRTKRNKVVKKQKSSLINSTTTTTTAVLFDFEQNNFYNYIHANNNEILNTEFIMNNNYCESFYASVTPYEFQEFGDFKVWYV